MCCHVVFPLIAVIYDILLPSIQYQLTIVLLISRPVMYYLLQPAMGLPAQALERTKLYRRTAHLRRTHRAHGTHSLTAEKEPQEVAKHSPLRSKTCI